MAAPLRAGAAALGRWWVSGWLAGLGGRGGIAARGWWARNAGARNTGPSSRLTRGVGRLVRRDGGITRPTPPGARGPPGFGDGSAVARSGPGLVRRVVGRASGLLRRGGPAGADLHAFDLLLPVEAKGRTHRHWRDPVSLGRRLVRHDGGAPRRPVLVQPPRLGRTPEPPGRALVRLALARRGRKWHCPPFGAVPRSRFPSRARESPTPSERSGPRGTGRQAPTRPRRPRRCRRRPRRPRSPRTGRR
jgi:hypothetical protein